MVRIILGGEFRGNSETWQNIKNFSEHHKAKIYIGNLNNWDWDLESEYTKTNILSDTKLNNSTHPHKDNYIAQWSHLYGCYNHFKNNFSDDDIIVKLRNDLVFPIFELNPKENTIHTPNEEGHGIVTSPYDSNIICNDQIVYGYKKIMDFYFELPYKLKLPFDRINGALQRYGNLISIEEILRNYLYQQNINLKTFPLKYRLLKFT